MSAKNFKKKEKKDDELHDKIHNHVVNAVKMAQRGNCKRKYCPNEINQINSSGLKVQDSLKINISQENDINTCMPLDLNWCAPLSSQPMDHSPP